MNRFVVYVVGVIAMLALLAAPALIFDIPSSSEESSEPTTISRYDASFTVDRNGDLSAVESIDVDFPSGDRHGIFRFFDQYDANAPHARRTPEGISVTMDGDAVDWERESQGRGRYAVLRIGDADRLVAAGTHRYVLRYTIPGILLEDAQSGSSFYWNVVPGGWRQSMRDVDIRVSLPVPSAKTVRCAVGAGATSGCTPTGVGTRELAVHLDTLAAETPVTLLTHLDLKTPPEGGHLPWTMRWDHVLGTHVWLTVLVVLLGVAGGLLGGILGARAREKEPPFPLVYAPPPGVNPAQGAYILRETIPRHAFVATLLDGAQRGTVSIERGDGGWRLTDTDGSDDPDDFARQTVRRLAGAGGTFDFDKKDVANGHALQTEMSQFKSSVKLWALDRGYLSRTGFAGVGGVLVFGGLGLMLANLLWNPFGMTLLGIIPGAFAILGFSMAVTGAGTKRTRTGRDLWSQLGGFRRILSTPSSRDRFECSGRTELYTAYIPWAVAFDCAQEWADKYRTEVGSEPPVPTYFAGYYAGSMLGHGDPTSALVQDFDSTVNSAIASYAATQRSSSSGGGGGGFGGGGGGGGSW